MCKTRRILIFTDKHKYASKNWWICAISMYELDILFSQLWNGHCLNQWALYFQQKLVIKLHWMSVNMSVFFMCVCLFTAINFTQLLRTSKFLARFAWQQTTQLCLSASYLNEIKTFSSTEYNYYHATHTVPLFFDSTLYLSQVVRHQTHRTEAQRSWKFQSYGHLGSLAVLLSLEKMRW